MSEQTQRQVIIRRPWWLDSIREFFKWLGVLGLIALIGYGVWYVFEWYGIAGFALGMIVMTPVFYRLVKPAGAYVIEAQPTGEVNLFYFPDPLFEKWAIEGDLRFSYHTKKGKPVIIAERVNFDDKSIQICWSHELSTFEFMRRANTFIWCRDELYKHVRKNALLECALADLIALGVEEQVEWSVKPVLRKLGLEEEEIEKAIRILRMAQEVEVYAERAPGSGAASEA